MHPIQKVYTMSPFIFSIFFVSFIPYLLYSHHHHNNHSPLFVLINAIAIIIVGRFIFVYLLLWGGRLVRFITFIILGLCCWIFIFDIKKYKHVQVLLHFVFVIDARRVFIFKKETCKICVFLKRKRITKYYCHDFDIKIQKIS